MPFNLRSEYLAEFAALGRSDKTIDIYTYALGQCEEWRGQPIEDITRLEARAFTRYLTETYKPSGVDSRLKALRAYFNWLIREDHARSLQFRLPRATVGTCTLPAWWSPPKPPVPAMTRAAG